MKDEISSRGADAPTGSSFILPPSSFPRPAVFLDRDGVLNRSEVREGRPYAVTRVEDFVLLPCVAEACAQLKSAGFLLVVVTNQPDVSHGTLRLCDLEEMHRRMCAALPLDRVEVCFDAGESDFKKPAPGMVLRAARELGIDLTRSFLVGDRWRDVDCGHAAGCATIFIDHGYAEPLRVPPDYRVSNLSEAARVILGSTPRNP